MKPLDAETTFARPSPRFHEPTRLLPRPFKWFVSSLLIIGGFATCGGEGGVQAPVSPPAPPPVILDFGPIAGDWAGWAIEPSGVAFWVRAHLDTAAPAGGPAGTVTYGLDAGGPPECGGTWLASKVEPPVYELEERITFGGGCPNGTVRLELLASGTLAYDFAPVSGGAFAEGTLTRGTDPGTPP